MTIDKDLLLVILFVAVVSLLIRVESQKRAFEQKEQEFEQTELIYKRSIEEFDKYVDYGGLYWTEQDQDLLEADQQIDSLKKELKGCQESILYLAP